MNPLIKIKTEDIGCRKPGCKRRLEIPHRHHRKCETLFIHAFKQVGLDKSAKYKKLKSRYEEFRDEDTVVVCAWHHAEIHLLYNEVIAQDMQQRKRGLSRYSWKQAESLMKKLDKECLNWLEEETPGVNPSTVFIPDKPKRKTRRRRRR